jgi:hypothetical protein
MMRPEFSLDGGWLTEVIVEVADAQFKDWKRILTKSYGPRVFPLLSSASPTAELVASFTHHRRNSEVTL